MMGFSELQALVRQHGDNFENYILGLSVEDRQNLFNQFSPEIAHEIHARFATQTLNRQQVEMLAQGIEQNRTLEPKFKLILIMNIVSYFEKVTASQSNEEIVRLLRCPEQLAVNYKNSFLMIDWTNSRVENAVAIDNLIKITASIMRWQMDVPHITPKDPRPCMLTRTQEKYLPAYTLLAGAEQQPVVLLGGGAPAGAQLNRQPPAFNLLNILVNWAPVILMLMSVLWALTQQNNNQAATRAHTTPRP